MISDSTSTTPPILFGSQLLKKLFPRDNVRAPNDTDYIVFSREKARTEKLANGHVVEYHYLPLAPRTREMNADEFYTLKCSHADRDIHWSKTMSDIRFMQMKGCNLVPSFFNELRSFWNEHHGINKRTDFGVMNKTEFFKDNVKRKKNHDELHLLLQPSPSYLKIVDNINNNGVTPLEEKFNTLSVQEKNDVAAEEAFVIALERYTSKHSASELSSYHMAQRDLVTRLHPLWLADYVIQNWNNTFWTASKTSLSLFNKYKELFKDNA